MGLLKVAGRFRPADYDKGIGQIALFGRFEPFWNFFGSIGA